MRCSNILCLFALPGRAGDGEVADPGNIHPLDACLTPPSSQPSDEPTRRATQFLSPLLGSSRRVTIREAFDSSSLSSIDLPTAELGKQRIWLGNASGRPRIREATTAVANPSRGHIFTPALPTNIVQFK